LWGYAQIEHDLQTIGLFGPDRDLKTSIVDTSKEFGILSPYTSMLIVEETRFEELAIDQTNKKRLATEQAAQKERKAKPVQSTRVDTQKPMFKGNQPSHSGGGGGGGSGSLGILGLLLALSALTIGLKMRRRTA